MENPVVFKAIKYTLIEIAEPISNTLQHILPRGLGGPVSGYIDTLVKANDIGIISADLFLALRLIFE